MTVAGPEYMAPAPRSSMEACQWLHGCGPRVFLFDWFKCISEAYAVPPDAERLLPPLEHFLRHTTYFGDSAPAVSKRAKRAKVEGSPVDLALLQCAALVRRAVCDLWHRPQLSWAVAPCHSPAKRANWPDFVGKFDSAAALSGGGWQPFLQTTMHNASQHCSTLQIGAVPRSLAHVFCVGALCIRDAPFVPQAATSSSYHRAVLSGADRCSARCSRFSRENNPACSHRLDDITSLDAADAVEGRLPAQLLIVDPPWPNRSVLRSRAYAALTCADLLHVPLQDWCPPPPSHHVTSHGSLSVRLGTDGVAAVWVTNDPAVQSFVRVQWLPKVQPTNTNSPTTCPRFTSLQPFPPRDSPHPQCGLSVVAVLCWYKVTCAGHPVCPLDSPHKKPFEMAYIARRLPPAAPPPPLPQTVYVCCPPSCHSRKPPLEAILPPLRAELGLGDHWQHWQSGAGGGEVGVTLTWVELFGRECRRGGLVVGNQAVALNRRHAWLQPM